jgi:hypothetical protein
VGTAQIHADARTDMTKVIGAFRDYANSLNTVEMVGHRWTTVRGYWKKVFPTVFAVNSCSKFPANQASARLIQKSTFLHVCHTHDNVTPKPDYRTLKVKEIPLQAWTGPECPWRLKLPDFKTIGIWRRERCQPYAPAAFTPRKYSW